MINPTLFARERTNQHPNGKSETQIFWTGFAPFLHRFSAWQHLFSAWQHLFSAWQHLFSAWQHLSTDRLSVGQNHNF